MMCKWGFFFRPSDEDLSLGTQGRKNPRGNSGSLYTNRGNAPAVSY